MGLARVLPKPCWTTGPTGTFTPLSETLVDVGRYFAGQYGFGRLRGRDGNTSPIDLDCRENFVVVMTDGEPHGSTRTTIYGSDVSNTQRGQSTSWNTIGNADGDYERV